MVTILKVAIFQKWLNYRKYSNNVNYLMKSVLCKPMKPNNDFEKDETCQTKTHAVNHR